MTVGNKYIINVKHSSYNIKLRKLHFIKFKITYIYIYLATTQTK